MSDEDSVVSRIPDLSNVSLEDIAQDPQYARIAGELVQRLLDEGAEIYVCNPLPDLEGLAEDEPE